MTKAQRHENLMPGGIPRYIRCYDNGGRSFARFTVVFTGKYKKDGGEFIHLSMSPHPFHPQGFGQHGFSQTHIDLIGNSWAGPAIGRTHPVLGKRIPFEELPTDCQALVLRDYTELWDLMQEK